MHADQTTTVLTNGSCAAVGVQLRLAGNALAGGGNLEAAIDKYQEVGIRSIDSLGRQLSLTHVEIERGHAGWMSSFMISASIGRQCTCRAFLLTSLSCWCALLSCPIAVAWCGMLCCAVQALGLKPGKGSHMLYSNLSAAYLQLGLKSEALQAAHSSVQLAPKGFHMVRNRQRNSNHCNSIVTGGMVCADRI